MEWNWASETLQAAFIEGGFNLLATVVAAISAAIIGHQINSRRKLEEDLAAATADIAFLLAVEKEHCNLHLESLNESRKITVRNLARERGFTWSGRFTPGRVRVQ